MRYYVTVGEVEEILEVESIDGQHYRVTALDRDGTPLGAAQHVALRDAGPVLHAEVAGARCYVSQGSSPAQLEVTTAAGRCGVSVVSARQHTLERLGRARSQRSGAASIKAPMPGRVVRILTSEGASVEAGQALIAIEAMKMENELLSERAGIVQRIFVKAGDSVEGGAELLRLSDAPS